MPCTENWVDLILLQCGTKSESFLFLSFPDCAKEPKERQMELATEAREGANNVE